jgi:hypothetical protein
VKIYLFCETLESCRIIYHLIYLACSDRRALESSLRRGFNELLLYDSDTKNIYEGLSSNFFAVLFNPDTQRPIVVTAPKRCVLEGTILRIVEEICERDDIELRFWFPNVSDVDMWTGAFITS